MAYEYQGYHVTRRGGANPDGGIDLVIEKDGQRSAVQCKQWKTWNVGVKAVREFLGALTDAQIQHGIFITLNGYTSDAKQLAEKHGIEIINETGLTAMLEGLNIQEDPQALEILNDTRKFCPKCERLMVERVAGKGPNPGQRFWGCTGYPTHHHRPGLFRHCFVSYFYFCFPTRFRSDVETITEFDWPRY
jgi:restriction system protein